MITREEIIQTFMDAKLTGNYDFDAEDLEKLAHAFINKAKPVIVAEERKACLDIARSVNHLVATRIEQVRGKA